MKLGLAIFACVLLVGVSGRLAHGGDLDVPEYDESECGGLKSSYGPFDYRFPPPNAVELVENVHYFPALTNLRTGQMSNERGFIWNDFDYTIRVFPNHHGALQAIDQLSLRLKSDKPPRAARSAKCSFLRAIKFTPNDGKVRILFGFYLLRRDQPEAAIVQLNAAAQLGEESGNLHYNLGLLYYRTKDYPKAREHAKKAFAVGFTLPGLRNLLTKAGQWQEDASDAPNTKATK